MFLSLLRNTARNYLGFIFLSIPSNLYQASQIQTRGVCYERKRNQKTENIEFE